ncbi:hypothetical protein NDU88_008863 [Pleurodeles waltl]|uniref:Uncharacterized protein n=1 Tax=Pleurodeles waltl TaxID=8319 RepID=A0AAV7RY54_PLEWA|nr:hypothetical protein NDU88_008863 [Pleurodeles waltl]
MPVGDLPVFSGMMEWLYNITEKAGNDCYNKTGAKGTVKCGDEAGEVKSSTLVEGLSHGLEEEDGESVNSGPQEVPVKSLTHQQNDQAIKASGTAMNDYQLDTLRAHLWAELQAQAQTGAELSNTDIGAIQWEDEGAQEWEDYDSVEETGQTMSIGASTNAPKDLLQLILKATLGTNQGQQTMDTEMPGIRAKLEVLAERIASFHSCFEQLEQVITKNLADCNARFDDMRTASTKLQRKNRLRKYVTLL